MRLAVIFYMLLAMIPPISSRFTRSSVSSSSIRSLLFIQVASTHNSNDSASTSLNFPHSLGHSTPQPRRPANRSGTSISGPRIRTVPLHHRLLTPPMISHPSTFLARLLTFLILLRGTLTIYPQWKN
jgi:hypothetical protein